MEPVGRGELKILEKTDDYAIVGCGRVVLLVWRTHSTARGIERVDTQLRRWAAVRPGGVVLMPVVAVQPARPPDDQVRAAMRRVLQAPAPELVGLGTIHPGTGFVAAFVRALVSGLQRLHPGAIPMRVFPSPVEAAGWAADLLDDPGITPEALARAIRAGRES